MVAPVPKTKAVELLLELSNVEIMHLVLNEFYANKYLAKIKKLLESNVDIATLWVCKGFVYSLANQPKAMYDAFANAQKLGATDAYSMMNQSTQYLLNGFIDEAIFALSLNKDPMSQNQIERIAISTFAFSKIEKYDFIPETKEKLSKIESRIKDVNIDIAQAETLLRVFFNLLQAQKIRFGLVRHSIIDEEYYLHFEAVTQLDVTQTVLKYFDEYIADHPELYDVNSKINVVLTPVSSIYHKFVA
ncbi:hypothetical protein ASC84_00695 [Acinetobacter sp. Root1280]|uniref:hypothetical protein n=1 Tax=Acinetobacter sp. Root1280 TaxID=1736444 RepID=UPI0006FE77E2|nr:hypothetical protein [Acinetobacter sp. Root1280]KQX03255.1 hypothetical protein ASC84_00695 [Acinetobacter sp. Root1280]